MRIVAILMLTVLFGCTQTQGRYQYGSDNHRFIYKENENLNPEINFILLKTQEEYDAARKKNLGSRWDEISAFTLWIPETGKCTVYVKDPDWVWEPELLGHEVAHCIWGRYHNGKKGLRQ